MSFMSLITSLTVTASDLAISTLILTGVVLTSPLLYLANFYLRCKRHQAATPWPVQDKVVVITGASSGIGEELAYEFARQGAKLILCARRADKLANISRVCKEKYGTEDVKIIKIDVTRESDVDRLVETVSADYDKVDCLVLNAGVSMGEKLEELEEFNTIKQINDVNYIGSAMLAYYFLPLLKKGEKSRIVVTSSLLGVVPSALKTGYAASKFALRGFFESLQAELIDQNIFITIAYPGIVATEINENRLGTKARDLDYSRGIGADECAKLIVDGTIKGHKEINYTKEGKLGRILEAVFPDLLFYISYNQAKKFVGKEKSS